MLSLLVTSVIISQRVFGFLPVTSTFSMRQIHAMVAHLALLIAGAHLGLHWSKIMGLACSRLGITTMSRLYISLVRVAALVIAAVGVQSLFVINVGPKLSMQVIFEFWDFESKTLAFFLHYMAIIGLCAFLSQKLQGEGSHGPITAPLGTMTTLCFWNIEVTRAQAIIDVEHGELLPLAPTPPVEEAIEVLGRPVPTTRYAITGSSGWAGLATSAPARSGTTVTNGGFTPCSTRAVRS
jgi:hypothetical protein